MTWVISYLQGILDGTFETEVEVPTESESWGDAVAAFRTTREKVLSRTFPSPTRRSLTVWMNYRQSPSRGRARHYSVEFVRRSAQVTFARSQSVLPHPYTISLLGSDDNERPGRRLRANWSANIVNAFNVSLLPPSSLSHPTKQRLLERPLPPRPRIIRTRPSRKRLTRPPIRHQEYRSRGVHYNGVGEGNSE